MSKKTSDIIIAFIGIACFLYVFYRASVLSITIDEAATSMMLQESYADIAFNLKNFQTANNHILNSLLMKLSASFFGTKEWALRLPNVLAYLMYLGGSLVLSKRLFRSFWPAIFCFLLLQSSNYALDFFSLCRGYGLALGFQLVSIASYVGYLRGHKVQHLLLSFLFASLAIFSNFIWFYFFAALWAFHFLHSLRLSEFKVLKVIKAQWVPALFFAISILSSINIINHLSQKGEFKYGYSSLNDSFRNFVANALYKNDWFNDVWVVSIGVLLVFSIVASIFALRKNSNLSKNTLLIFSTALSCLIVLISLVANYFLDIKLLQGRRALMFFPLFLLMFISSIGFLSQYVNKLSEIVLVISCLGALFLAGFSHNVFSVREWWFNENDREVFELFYQEGAENIVADPLFYWTFNYYNKHYFNEAISNIVAYDRLDPKIAYDHYYINGTKYDMVPADFKPLKRYGWDRFAFIRDIPKWANTVDRLPNTWSSSQKDSIIIAERSRFDWDSLD